MRPWFSDDFRGNRSELISLFCLILQARFGDSPIVSRRPILDPVNHVWWNLLKAVYYFYQNVPSWIADSVLCISLEVTLVALKMYISGNWTFGVHVFLMVVESYIEGKSWALVNSEVIMTGMNNVNRNKKKIIPCFDVFTSCTNTHSWYCARWYQYYATWKVSWNLDCFLFQFKIVSIRISL